MTRFEKFIEVVFKNEGFISDDKDDSGGLTKYGISQKAFPNLNIRALTKAQAQQIYKLNYYDKCKIDAIKNEMLAIHVFDMAVNAGVSRSSKMLQKIVGVKDDGIIGINTLTATNKKDYSNEFINARISFYNSIARGKNEKFLKGWLNRVKNTTNSI